MKKKEIRCKQIIGIYDNGIIEAKVSDVNNPVLHYQVWKNAKKTWRWSFYDGLHESELSIEKIENNEMDFIKSYLRREHKIIFDKDGKYDKIKTMEALLNE